jgi:hypothetical protein
MTLAHGNTPLHDDPTFWHLLSTLGGVGTVSFIIFAIRQFLARASSSGAREEGLAEAKADN